MKKKVVFSFFAGVRFRRFKITLPDGKQVEVEFHQDLVGTGFLFFGGCDL